MNVIVLTHGWTGSSVFTALIGKAGYWLGDETFQKIDYDTYENAELVALNNMLLESLGYSGDREHEVISEAVLKEVLSRSESFDSAPYQAFAEKIKRYEPWIWKDPRLILTIRIWERFISLDDVAFIILTRDDEQAWITSNLRKHIQSPGFTRKYNHAITDSFKSFLKEKNKGYVEFQFEDLQLRPEWTIEKLNAFLGTNLTITDLREVYNKPLYRKSKSFRDKLVAIVIYLKNYGQRDGR